MNTTQTNVIALFFTLSIIFGITQLSHTLFLHLDYHGMLQTGVLWLAVWLGWQYTTSTINWFDLQKLSVHLLFFGIMLASILMAAIIPTAFNYNGLIFAICYVTMQVGRTLVVLLLLGNKHEMSPYFRRIMVWLCISATFWLLGGAAESEYRLGYWALAVACEWFAPLFGFWLPFLGRSNSKDRIRESDQLVQRYQLLMIVGFSGALYEAGLTVSNALFLSSATLIAFIVAFIGSVAMWWLYFECSSENTEEKIGAKLHYIHVSLLAGIIGFAVDAQLMISDPANHLKTPSLVIMVAGPIIYLISNAIYKMIINHHFPLSHLMGILALVLLIPLADFTDTFRIGAVIVLILVFIALWESYVKRYLKK